MEPFFAQFGPVTAIEPNAFARGLAKRHGVTLRSGRAERTGLKKESTTLVALCDVLYHKGVDDRRALAESYRLLSRGGYLLITDCAMPFLTGPHDREFDARERYTLSGLAEKVGKAGLDVVYGSYTFYLLFPVVMAIRMFSRLWFRRTKRSDVVPMDDGVNRLLVRINAWEAAGIGRVKYPYGSSLILLAKKR
jgi:SAM-dependent methyltransferase